MYQIFINVSDIHTFKQRVQAPPLVEAQRYKHIKLSDALKTLPFTSLPLSPLLLLHTSFLSPYILPLTSLHQFLKIFGKTMPKEEFIFTSNFVTFVEASLQTLQPQGLLIASEF